jgi:outer membrane protein TolC
LAVLLAFVASSVGAAAQTAQEYVPPVIRFAPQGIGIEEAVRLTIEHEPTIKVQEAQTDLQEGIAQEQTGFFDATLAGAVSYEYRQQELPESRKELERDTRQALADGLSDNAEDRDRGEELKKALGEAIAAPNSADKVDRLVAADAQIGAQVRIIDALLKDVTQSQARAQLQSLRATFLDQTLANVDQGLARLLEQFRESEGRLIDLGDVPQDEVFYVGSGDVQWDRLFRNGISVTPFFDASVDGTNFKGKPRSGDFGGKGLEDLFTFRAGVSAVVPLGRGRGAEAAGAGERAARIEHDASLLAYRHQAAVSSLNTVFAYWDLRAVQDAVAVATRSVELQQIVLQATQQLINGGQLPQVEIARVQASLARSQARLEDDRRRLHEARAALATTIGLTVTEDDATLPFAQDDFPDIPEAGLLEEQAVVTLATQAVDRREDLLATARLEESGRVLERRAETDLRPRLDVVASMWTTALDERTVSSAVDRWVGPSTTVALEFEKPLGNNVFRGRLAQQQADLRQRQIDVADLRRLIRLAVVRSARSVQDAVGRVQHAEAAVGFYQTTVDAEIERLRAGESTVVDTVLTEQQQTEAQRALIAARKELAQLIAELRFESGRLLEPGSPESSVRESSLVTVPGRDGGTR